MTLKTKAVLNYIVSGIFLILTIVHIYDGESVFRIVGGDIIPLIWFGAYAMVCVVRHYKNKSRL